MMSDVVEVVRTPEEEVVPCSGIGKGFGHILFGNQWSAYIAAKSKHDTSTQAGRQPDRQWDTTQIL